MSSSFAEQNRCERNRKDFCHLNLTIALAHAWPPSALAQQQHSFPAQHPGWHKWARRERVPTRSLPPAQPQHLTDLPGATEASGAPHEPTAKILSKVTCSVHVNDQAGQTSQIAKMKNASLIHLNLSNLIAFCLSMGGWGASLESLKKSDKKPRCYMAARLSSPAAGRDPAAFTWVTHITVPMGWLQFRGSANDKQSLLYQPINSISIYAGMKLEVQIRPATKPFQQLHLIRYCVLFTENIHHTIPTHKMRTKYKDKSCTPITC